jgi:3-hydroxybutyryl-CoA dehydrogenase
MVEEGDASAEDIDTAIRTGFGLRFAVLGMLEFIELGRLRHSLLRVALPCEGRGERFLPAQFVRSSMHNLRKGLRDGAGFYEYADVDAAP